MEELEKQISEILEHIISIRRHIHQNPELGYEEKATSELVAKELKSLCLKVEEGVGGYGVVGILEGDREKLYSSEPIWMHFLLRKKPDFPLAQKSPASCMPAVTIFIQLFCLAQLKCYQNTKIASVGK